MNNFKFVAYSGSECQGFDADQSDDMPAYLYKMTNELTQIKSELSKSSTYCYETDYANSMC